jgi:uncharacterized protein (TIGR03437 family)
MLKRLTPLLFASVALAQNPTISDVTSGASLPGSRSGLSPGGRANIFGSNFAAAPSSKVSVTVGGKSAYVVSSNPFGIDAELPFEVPSGATTLSVTVEGRTSAPFNINLETYAPGILSCIGTSSCAFGSFLNAKGSFASPSEPASPGDTLLAGAVGLGPTNPPTPTGPAPNTRPTASPVTLTIGGTQGNASGPPVGGTAADVSFAGFQVGAAGDYQVNFKVPSGVQGTQAVYLTIGGKTSNPVNIPLFGIGSVVSNASFGSRATAAPGSIVTVFANGLGSTDQLSGFPATKFQGVSVSFNGTPAPLFHLSASLGQIDLIVPSELPTSGTVNVQLTTPSGTSNYTLTMASAVPAFYRLADPYNGNRLNVIAQFSGTAWLAMPVSMAAALNLPGNCAARNADPLAACAQPAAPGDYLVLYATGLGKTTPNGDSNGTPLATGASPPANGSVLYKTVIPPAVTIGGIPATVLYSGLAPGFPGLYQVDVQVPNGVAAGDDVPVILSLPGGGNDNTVTISVHPRP